MIKIFFVFLLLFVSAWVGVALHSHPGYVLIAVEHWTVETTLAVAVAILGIAFLIFHILFLLIRWAAHTPEMWRHFRTKRKVQAAQAKTRQGLIEFSEGHWQQARNHLINALPNAETPLLNYLTAARAAQEMGDSQLRDDYLRQAQQSMPEAKIAVELTQAQLQLANKQWEQALATLRHLQDLSPRHPYVLKLLLHLYEEVKDWPQLIALLPDLKRNQVISLQELKRIEKQAYLQNLLDIIKQDQEPVIHAKMKMLPKHLACDTDIMGQYCRYLLQKKEFTLAESQLRHCLNKQFDSTLIHLYGKIPGNLVQLKFLESLLKNHPHSHALYLCLGRIYHSNHLWGQARQYYEKSIELHASIEAYYQLGCLLEQLEDEKGACLAYQQGLALAI